MTELKPGWRWVALGDVVDVITDYWDRDPSRSERYVAGEHIDEGSLRVTRWGMTDDELVPPTFNRRFKTGDVLFHSRNLRKLAQPGFEGVTGEKIFVLRTRDPQILRQELLPYLLQVSAFSEYTEKMWAGSTNKFLNKAPLIRYEFALPPLGEQLEFAYLLKASESTKEVLENAYACALAVRDRLRLQAGIAAAKTVKLAEWIVFLTSGSRGWAKYYSEAGDTFLRLGNLNSSTIDLNLADIQHVQPQNDGEGERTIVQPDDVLLGITGEAGVGLVAIARDCDDRQFISQHIALIRLDKTKASGDFVAHVLAGPFGQRQIWSHNQPSAKAGMTLIAVKEILMPCLSLEEQKDWAWKTNQAEAAMIDIEKRLSKCKKLSRILREACTANDWVE